MRCGPLSTGAHPLAKDFPELHQSLQHLRQQAAQYAALDKPICRVEDGVELLGEAALTTLEQQRAALKDALGRQLKQASGTCCGGCGG
ncbi:MAG: GTP-binding protein [Pseudomonadota bacterium]